jgi:hypothetical protein
MTTLTVRIDDKKAEALNEKARLYSLPVETLLLASLDNLVTQPSQSRS